MAARGEGTLLAGRYRVLGRLGAGGMATVYLAEDERLGRRVAVKRLHAESPRDMATRIEREAKLGASLNHQNLVGIFDTEIDAEGVLIVMEYVDGETLSQAMRSGRLETGRALEVVRGMAAGLDHVHEQGVLHRDVKPANVLLGAKGQVKITDLGIATATEGTRITATGIVLGTPSYMAPEQLEGKRTGPPADVYALAAVAFEALSGRKARVGDTPLEIARRAISDPPPDIREAWPEAPAAAAEVLQRGMALDPRERPATAGELAGELSAAVSGEAADGGERSRGAVAVAPVPSPIAAISPSPVPAPSPSPDPTGTPRPTPPARPSEPARPSPIPQPRPAPSPAASRTRAPAGGSGRRRVGRLAPVAALLLLAVAGIAIVATAGGGDENPDQAAQDRAADTARGQGEPAAPTGESDATAEPPATPTTADPDAPAPTTGPSPDETVQAFYQRGADGDFEGAASLAGPGVLSQLGGSSGIEGTLGTLESIEFTRLETVEESATDSSVAFATVATHPDRIDRCTGTAALSRAASGWLLEKLSAGCQSEPRGGPAAAPASGEESGDEG